MTPKKRLSKPPANQSEVNIEKEVEKLITNSAYKNPADGLWYVYDQENKQWRSQDEDPNVNLESLSIEKLGQKDGLLDRSKKIIKLEKIQPISEEELVFLLS